MNIQQYRKRPLIVDAIKYLGIDHLETIQEWAQQVGIDTGLFQVRGTANESFLYVVTVEGNLVNVPVGCFIVKDIKGHPYPCNEEVFLKTYERVLKPISHIPGLQPWKGNVYK